MKLIKRIAVGCVMVFSSLVAAESKVLLIGIDGVQFEKLQAAHTPNIDKLNISKAFTGGIAGTGTEQQTSSGPGWSTILTGVWANKHRITANDDDLANPDFPSVFKRIRDAKPNAYIASIAHWGTPNTHYFRNDVVGNNLTLNGISDQAVTDKVIDVINTTSADFIFAHLDDPDHYGHSQCFGSAYQNSIEVADAQVGQMMATVNAKMAQGEDWLVLITTDHGRTPIVGCGHGNQSVQEKTIFIASNQSLNHEFNQPANNLENQDFNGLYAYPSQASITPTVLRHLGIEPLVDWALDGIPLNGDLAVRKLMASNTNADLTWVPESDANVDVFRNGQLVDNVNDLEGQWSDLQTVNGVLDYTLVKNGTPATWRLNRLDITAALDWNATRAYFFRSDDQYVRYSKILDKADAGYPSATNEATWPGLGAYADKIVAAFRKNTDKAYFFLNDGNYIRYDISADEADAGYPKPINNDTWPGMENYATSIVAALRWSGNRVYFFLDNGQYIRYNLVNDRVDSGYPKVINNNTWPGLGDYANEIQSAVKWNDGRGYIFLKNQKYVRYNIALDRVDAGYPSGVNNDTWPGLMN